MNKIMLLFFYVLTGCSAQKSGVAPFSGEFNSTAPNPEVVPEPAPMTKEQELEALVQFFKTRYNANFNFEISFRSNMYFNGDGIIRVIGVCELYSDGTKKMLFNEEWWVTSHYESKKVLVLHEFGHCYFNRAHDSRLLSGHPKSLMYPLIDPLISSFGSNQNYYLDELHSGANILSASASYVFKTLADGGCE